MTRPFISNRPMILDLYCCQGGAGMGYYRAGFDVIGVDSVWQPRYPFPFWQIDALDVLRQIKQSKIVLEQLAAVHASPPCQAKTKAQKIQKRDHPRLIGPTRDLLLGLGLPYVIENVVPEDPEMDDDPLLDPIELCGAMFDLGTYRHRLFETNFPLLVPDHPEHTVKTTKMGRKPKPGEFMHVVGNFSGVAQAKKAMGIDWMTRDGLREAIPPAYTQYIGTQLIAYLNSQKEAA